MANSEFPPIRLVDGVEKEQVVVKFKTTEASRESLRVGARGFSAEAVRSPASAGAGDPIFAAPGLRAVEPLFPEEGQPRMALGERFLLSVPARRDDELAAFNVFSFNTEEQAEAQVERCKHDKRVEYAHVIQPRYLFARTAGHSKAPRRRAATGVDPLKNRQWGLTAIQLAQAQALQSFKEATSVKIGVIDTGVDSSHPDLGGIFAEEKNFTSAGSKDTQGHGTHVSGIIAAITNNALGIAGVCQSKSLYALKALGPYDGPGYYRAIRYAISSKLQVVNFSLGGSHDPTEEILIKMAIQAGIVIVAAMGNDKLKGNPTSYPAAIDAVIAVGASDESDRRADFSQTGSHIHLVAPGVNILSTVPTYPSALATTVNYEAWPGTSMATPFVTAAVALMLARKPGATVTQIRDALKQGVDLTPGQNGFNNDFGYGRLNLKKALAAI